MINPSNYSQGSQKHHTTVTMPFATSWFYRHITKLTRNGVQETWALRGLIIIYSTSSKWSWFNLNKLQGHLLGQRWKAVQEMYFSFMLLHTESTCSGAVGTCSGSPPLHLDNDPSGRVRKRTVRNQAVCVSSKFWIPIKQNWQNLTTKPKIA